MNDSVAAIWVYLAESPLLGLTLTLVCYQLACTVHARLGGHPAANPVLLSVAMLAAILLATDTPYPVYFEGAQFVHFLLGPATVALAIPLYAQFGRLRALAGPLLLALVAGSLAAALSAVVLGALLGGDHELLMSLAPKSVTTPIAMGVAEKLGGLPSLTAVLVIATGILGAVGARYVFRCLRIEDDAIRGFAIGLAAHGIGTARAFQVSEQAGAFAALAMGLNGLFTAVALPLLLPWLVRLLGA
ncbi:MAG: LrgB family protein [Gammaproteobacteria bacterium]|nr:LrgB family protein [Gammaproteobacteria bacterium]